MADTLDAATLGELRARLEQERDRLRRLRSSETPERLAGLRDALPEDAFAVEPKDFGDMGYDIMMEDTELALSENDLVLLRRVEHALQRMDEGTYGTSEVSGKPIPLERLQALPWATTNVDDAPDGGRMAPTNEY